MSDAPQRFACLDAAYGTASAHAACVLFDGWRADKPARTLTASLDALAPYEPGALYKRELPVLLATLAQIGEPLEAIIVDGYVWLGGENQPGLGGHLRAALAGPTPVIGIAKTPYRDDDWSVRVLRGASGRPLYLTAAGIDPHIAATGLSAMHGEGRIPTMLRLADRMARELAAEMSR